MAHLAIAARADCPTPSPVAGRVLVLAVAVNDNDTLNRKVSETGTTGATNTGACPTGGTANLDTRSWDLPAASFSYDLAGRLAEASSSRIDFTWAYDAAGRATGRGGNWATHYRWDDAGNMTSVTYPDGSIFQYQYDALNRTAQALDASTTYGTLTYDALGRRNVLTFHDGSTQSYGYDNADRVTSISHAFPNDAADNLTLTYGYDNAGRETGRATSNAAYRYIPTVASTSYAATNALNQYPSVASYPYTYWPEGGLEQDDQRQNLYNELNKLTFAYITPTPGVIDPDNWWQGIVDPLGHVMAHERHAAAGVPYPYIKHSTDGLRPETVLDWQYQVPVSGPSILQGTREYVLGPDPDERWAFIDIGGAIDSPHVDRQGTIVALSNGGQVAQKYAYDAYGQSPAPLSDVGPGSNTYAFRFTGQRLDPGTGLYDFKARDYSPWGGRFLQPDPAGPDQGPNLYEYVDGDPINKADPTGNDSCGGSCQLPCTVAEVVVTAVRNALVPAPVTIEGTYAGQPFSFTFNVPSFGFRTPVYNQSSDDGSSTSSSRDRSGTAATPPDPDDDNTQHAKDNIGLRNVSQERVDEAKRIGREKPGNSPNEVVKEVPSNQSISGRGIKIVLDRTTGRVVTVIDKGSRLK